MNNRLVLSICIVNYKVEDLLRKCLNSIYESISCIGFETIIVDNNSADGSVEMIKSIFPQANLIENLENVGFSKANNQAISIANGKYILLLNPDTIVKDNAIEKMVNFMEENPEVGIIGCTLKNNEGKIEESCDNFPTFGSRIIGKISEKIYFLRKIGISMRCWNYDRLREVDSVSGACLLTRHILIQKIGGLDERFFMYHEDVDFCYRAKKAGFKTYFFPYSTVIHGYSKSKNWDPKEKKIVHRKTQYLFVKKHYGRFERFIYKFYFYVITSFL